MLLRLMFHEKTITDPIAINNIECHNDWQAKSASLAFEVLGAYREWTLPSY